MLDLIDIFANDKIKHKIFDKTLGVAANILDKVNPEYGNKIRELKTTHEFEKEFSEAIVRAIKNINVNNLSKEELEKIKKILLDEKFINNTIVANSIKEMLLRPESDLSSEVSLVIDEFSKTHNEEIEQNNITIVLGNFLVNLAKEVQGITLFREALDFYYNKQIAESTKRQEIYSYTNIIDKVLSANEKGKAHILLDALKVDGVDIAPMIQLLERNGENVDALLPLLSDDNKQISYIKKVERFIDWGRSRDVDEFYGRKNEIKTIIDYLLYNKKRLIFIDGIGGQGKTSLVLHVCKNNIDIETNFDSIIWRTLENSPSFESILNDILSVVSKHKFTNYENSINEKLIKLREYISQNRCLVILDNYETIVSFKDKSNTYRDEYIDYSSLIDMFSNINHNSTLLITSRVMPNDIKSSLKPSSPVYIMDLVGLDYEASKNILNDVCDCIGKVEDINSIIDFYSGNPFALDLVGRQIQEIYLGDIREFKQDNHMVFDKIFDLLSWHLSRINEYEKEVLYWLSIERDLLSIRDIREKIFSTKSRRNLPSTLKSLSRKLPIITVKNNKTIEYSLQPLIIEYVLSELVLGIAQEIHDSDLFISRVSHQDNIKNIASEISKNNKYLLSKYTLADPLSDYYIFQSQIEQIIKPLVEELLEELGSVDRINDNLKTILDYVRTTCPSKTSYTAGNIFNIISTIYNSVQNYDFSNLIIMNANLKGTQVANTDFTNSKFINSTFNQVFGNILSVNFSKNSDSFIASDTKGVVYQWDRGNYQQINDFQGHMNYVRIVQYSLDNNYILSGSDDHNIRIWSIKNNSCTNIFTQHSNWIRDLQFIDENMVISGDEDGIFYIWDFNKIRIIKKIDLKSRIWGFAINHQKNIIYISTDNGIVIYNQDTDMLEPIKYINGVIRAINISKDYTLIAYTSESGIIHILSTQDNKPLYQLSGHNDFIWDMDFNNTSDKIISSSEDNTIKVWDLRNKQCNKTLYGHTSRIRTCNFSSDNNYIISGSDDKSIRLWDKDGKCIHIVEGYSLEPICIEKLYDNLIISAGDDKYMRIWDVESKKNIKKLSGHQGRVWELSYDINNKILVSVGDDSKIKLWNMEKYYCINTLTEHLDWVWSVAVNNEGLFVTGSEDNTIKLWSYDNKQSIHTFDEHNGAILALDFHPINRKIFSSGSTDNTVKIWNIDSKSSINTLIGHDDKIWSVKFNQDGKLLATASEDCTIRVWDLSNGECLHVLKGHNDFALSTDFLSDKILISSSDDNTIKIWNLEDGKCIRTIQAHTDSIWSVQKYNNTFISCSKDGYIKKWNSDTFESDIELKPDILYEGMKISNVTGITTAQENTLMELGAIK